MDFLQQLTQHAEIVTPAAGTPCDAPETDTAIDTDVQTAVQQLRRECDVVLRKVGPGTKQPRRPVAQKARSKPSPR